MNKFEKLIEYIINDEDQKARELFHNIVVEKSRDIYESIMDEEQVGEHVHGEQVEDLTQEISGEEAHAMESDEEGEEQFGGEEEFGDEEGEEQFGSEEGEAEAHGEIEDQVMNIDAKLDELLAKFDEIMGDEGHGEEEMGGEEPAMDMGHDEMGADEQPEEGMYESGNPFAKSGKSGSAASGKSGSAASGKSGSAKSGKSGSAKGSSELMREYVDRIGDIYGGQGDATEGDAVGAAGKKTSVNAKPGSVGPGADFGGSVVKTSSKTENQDGTSPTKASNEYNKGQGTLIGKVGNTPGGDKKLSPTGSGHGAEKKGSGEGKLAGNDGSAPINKKSEIGGKIR